MDDHFYELEEKMSNGCAIMSGVVVVLMILVVMQMACNWTNSLINL